MVDTVRHATNMSRVGHAGTLDPFASGLLVVLLGRATRLSPYLSALPKSYEGVIRLGVRTDTDDGTGTVLSSTETWQDVLDADVAEAMAALTGRRLQRPPAYSAKKTGGERAYRLARQGRPVRLAPAEVEVTRFAVVERAGSAVRFVADVGSGTYIRALARDLGEALQCGAHLEALRRVGVGSFSVERATALEAIGPGRVTPLPPLAAVSHLPRFDIDPVERDAVGHGRPLPAGAVTASPVALVADGRLVAVAEVRDGRLKPRVVFTDG